jgi:hypothetical protein
MAGHDVLYNKTKREQTTRRQQSRTTAAILFSFPFIRVVQPTGWQGTTSTTKEQKEYNQAVTIHKNSDPVLFSSHRRCSTHWMAGHNVYYKRTKENNQTATIDNNNNTIATFNNNNLPLLRKSNNKLCVVVVKLERIHTTLQMQNTCVTKEGKCELTLLRILQWEAIPGLTWDLNAEMIEKSMSSKCIQAYKNTMYIIYHRYFYYFITSMIQYKAIYT